MNCGILIITNDEAKNYAWRGWNYFFRKHWNWNVEWPVYFGTEMVDTDFENVINIKGGKEKWGQYLLNCLNQIPEDYVMCFMVDHFPRKKIPTMMLKEILKQCHLQNITRFGIMQKYHPLQEPVESLGDFFSFPYYKLTKESGYLSSFQPSIWNKESLLKITEPEWTPWDGELKGTPKMSKMDVDVRYVIVKNWYREAYTKGNQPRNSRYGLDDYQILKGEYDWEK